MRTITAKDYLNKSIGLVPENATYLGKSIQRISAYGDEVVLWFGEKYTGISDYDIVPGDTLLTLVDDAKNTEDIVSDDEEYEDEDDEYDHCAKCGAVMDDLTLCHECGWEPRICTNPDCEGPLEYDNDTCPWCGWNETTQKYEEMI